MSADPYYRARYLPSAIERAERKLAALYAEDRGKSANALLADPDVFSRAWEIAVRQAQIEAAKQDYEASMGVDHV